jgi:hypothetical protein
MSSWLTDVNGAEWEDTSVEAVDRLFDDLELNADDEHISVTMTLDGIWDLDLYRSRVIFEHVEALGTAKHMMGVDRQERLAIATALIVGDLDSVNNRPWVPGYGT